MPSPARSEYEWPTLALLAATYLIWCLTTIHAQSIGPLAIPVLALTMTMHSSLQHETLHGHPLSNRALSVALVFPALGLLVPYGRFRDLHLTHHKDATLTDPYDDPESAYFAPEMYSTLSRPMKKLLEFNNTLLGRMLVGPALGIEAFYRTELQLLRAPSRQVWMDWGLHVPAVALVVLWLLTMGQIEWWAYLAAVYMSQSILKIRTYLEHQAHEQVSGRSVIIEDRGPLALLFLNNNLHSVHHAHPAVPWYDLPRLYRSRRQQYQARNRGYVFAGYGEIFRRYLVARKEPVIHPLPGRNRP